MAYQQFARVMQQRLKAHGYDIGKAGIDGIAGKDTRAALRKFQADMGLPETGTATRATMTALLRQPMASPPKPTMRPPMPQMPMPRMRPTQPEPQAVAADAALPSPSLATPPGAAPPAAPAPPPYGPMDPRSFWDRASTLPGQIGQQNLNFLSGSGITNRESWLGRRDQPPSPSAAVPPTDAQRMAATAALRAQLEAMQAQPAGYDDFWRMIMQSIGGARIEQQPNQFVKQDDFATGTPEAESYRWAPPTGAFR